MSPEEEARCWGRSAHSSDDTRWSPRDKNRLPVTPILSSVLRLLRYHLGTVAKGSFIITLVKIPRLVLMYIHNQLKGRVGALRRRTTGEPASDGY